MKRSSTITLIENSTAGNAPKVFAGQTVELAHEPDTVSQSLDGPIARASHASTVFWQGGTAKELANITNVKIEFGNGEVFEGELNKTHEAPRDVAGGVIFYVLKS